MKYAKVMAQDIILICSHCPDIAVKDLRSYYLFAFTSRRCRCLRQYTCILYEKIHENPMQYSQYADRYLKLEPIYYGAAVLSVP